MEEKKEVKQAECVVEAPVEVPEVTVEEHLPVHAEGSSPVLSARTPKELITKAKEIAALLKDIIIKRKLFVYINKKPFVYCEAWTTMGAMLNVFPYTVWTRRVDDGHITWESRVILRTLDGKVISAAEAMCSSAEHRWDDKDEFQIRSMAQTRATAKVYRLPFAWIITMAGYEPTPAEEMEEEAWTPPAEVEGNAKRGAKPKTEVPPKPKKPKTVWPDTPTDAIVKKFITNELMPGTQKVYVDEEGTKVPLFLLLSSTRDKKNMHWRERLLGCRNHLARAEQKEPAQMTKWLGVK